jgi:hypothetical protein
MSVPFPCHFERLFLAKFPQFQGFAITQTPVFKTGALNRSAIPPANVFKHLPEFVFRPFPKSAPELAPEIGEAVRASFL